MVGEPVSFMFREEINLKTLDSKTTPDIRFTRLFCVFLIIYVLISNGFAEVSL